MSPLALVVDDSMLVRHTVCRFLEERGFAVESASNGRDALAILDRVRPDIIITDMDMPIMGGSELITAVRARPESATTPIVVVAGRASGFSGKETRAQFTIFKDIDIDEQLKHALDATVGSSGRAASAE
jgi:CheY-like chemotaxis protein